MTKKLIAFAVCSAMLISLAGCGDKDKKTKKTKAEVDSSSLVDESSIPDSSVSDSSVPAETTTTKPVETNQTTTKAPSQTTKPVTTIKTSTVSAGCYQTELAKVKGWDNKYRPTGKYAYIKYGTQSAQQYYEVVKTAYDFAHNTTLVNKYKQIGINIFSSTNGNINGYFDRKDNLIPKDDNNFVMIMASSDYLTTTYKFIYDDSTLQLGNAYNVIKNKTGTQDEFSELIIAFANQCNAKVLFSKGIDKSGKVTYWIKVTDSKGQVWYTSDDDGAQTQAELLAAGNKITVSDYMG